MMSEEITTGRLTEDVIDHEVTPLLQELLSELKTGDDTRVNSVLAKIAKFIDSEKALREQHTLNKDIVVDLCTFPELSASCDSVHEALNEPADFWAQAPY